MAVEVRILLLTDFRADSDAPGTELQFNSRTAARDFANAINGVPETGLTTGIDNFFLNPGNNHFNSVFSDNPGLRRLTAAIDATGFRVTILGYHRKSGASLLPALNTPFMANMLTLHDRNNDTIRSLALRADPVPSANNNGKMAIRHGEGPRVAGVMAPRTTVENRPRTADGRQKIGSKARVSVSTPLGYRTPTLNRGR